MNIKVTFRGDLPRAIERKDVGIEVGKGVVAIFEMESDKEGKLVSTGECTMYPLDTVESIHVDPDEQPRENVVPIRKDLS